MKNIPTHGILTSNVLIMHSYCTGEHYSAYLKRALILFETLVLIPTGLGDMGGPGEFMSKRQWITRTVQDEPSVAEKLDELILLDRDIVEDADAFHSSLDQRHPEDLWTEANGDRFVSFINELVDRNNSVEDKWETKKFFIGNIDYDWRLFRVVSKDFDGCTALLTEIHERAVQATYGLRAPNAQSVIRKVADLNTFDFAQLTWADIFRLRESGFVTDFRKMIAEWVIAYEKADDSHIFQQSLTRMIEDAKFECIRATEPNARETILAGIGGNLPLPIGINPISLFGAVRDAVKQHRLKKEFGWLFFVERSRKLASNKRAGDRGSSTEQG